MKKAIILNLKTYPESTGAAGDKLCEIAEEVAKQSKEVEIIVAAQAPSLVKAAWLCKTAKVFSQASEAAKLGQSTGAVTPEAVAAAGCAGTLVNHSERRTTKEQVKEVVERASKVNLRVCACAASVSEGVSLAAFSPWAVAVEPPELIGSGVSVSSAQPKLVGDAVQKIRAANSKCLVLVGAGVSTAADVKKCVELGADGVLLASAFVKAKDPAALLREMVAALK